jgi:hypothetical protein
VTNCGLSESFKFDSKWICQNARMLVSSSTLAGKSLMVRESNKVFGHVWDYDLIQHR